MPSGRSQESGISHLLGAWATGSCSVELTGAEPVRVLRVGVPDWYRVFAASDRLAAGGAELLRVLDFSDLYCSRTLSPRRPSVAERRDGSATGDASIPLRGSRRTRTSTPDEVGLSSPAGTQMTASDCCLDDRLALPVRAGRCVTSNPPSYWASRQMHALFCTMLCRSKEKGEEVLRPPLYVLRS